MTNMQRLGINPLYPKARELYQKQLALIRESADLSESNKESIEQFLIKCQGAGISIMRLVFYANRLRQVTEILKKDFREAERADFERVMAKIEERGYKGHTIDAFIVSIKTFYRWLYRLDKADPLPKCVSWIERRRPPNTLKKEDLLTDEEVNLLIRRTDDPMIKTMLAVLYETAVRPEELRGMRMRDVHINTSMVKIYVRGKTAKESGERVVFCARSYPLIQDWVQHHINRGNPDGWLWPDRGDKSMPLSDPNLRQIIYRHSRLNLPGKHVWTYLFRHSMGTWIYKNFPSPIARRMMGHAPGSRMERVYVHLAEEDLVNAIEAEYNLRGDDKPVKNGVCVKCGSILYFGDLCCRKCGLAENSRKAYEKDAEEQIVNATMNTLMSDPQIQARILELREGIRQKLGFE